MYLVRARTLAAPSPPLCVAHVRAAPGCATREQWAQLRIAVIKGQLSPEKKVAVAEGVTKACAVLEVEADRVQVVYEELDRGNIAIGGKILKENI